MPLGRDCIVVQTMMYTSFIHLRRPGLFDQRAFKAANSIIRLLRQLSEEDYQYLDPILGVRCLVVSSGCLFKHNEFRRYVGLLHPRSLSVLW